MPWKELHEYNCGWWINNDQTSINETLRQAISIPESQRIQMGENGKKLIQERYSIEKLGGKMKRLYEWILNGDNKPEFVYE